jgi:hypothetical protein
MTKESHTTDMTGMSNQDKIELMRDLIACGWEKKQEINDLTVDSPVVDNDVPPPQDAQKKVAP